ncbi:pyridoxal-phosphate-dependent aminotransferase family protein [Halobacterium yunchengense]|uniref:pyridoxal-phosphate-dependent aminotransferase family protein n=1 Tax=Halobacterium yunchengense TaxID=3108497 RepID=UPI003009E3B5
MREDFLLLNPGPVPMTREARAAMAEPAVSHRSAAFEAVYERAQDHLEYVFEHSTPRGASTSAGGTALLLNGTATMGMEAAVANLTDRDSEVVSVVNGKFGRRFARIADRHADATRVDFDWGTSVDVDAVADAITDDTDVVTIVHNETSTGLLNPVEAVGELAAEHDARFVVDGVTSIGGDEFRVDDWHVDVAVTDGQKALAGPPGVSALYVTEAAADHVHGEGAPFYEDLDWHLRKAESNQTPFTSAVPLFRGLAAAVADIREEGMPDRIARHRRQAAAFREAFRAMGLESFPEVAEGSALSNTVTAVRLPEAVRGDAADDFHDAVAARGVSISGGQAHLGGEIFRVSNMGGLTSEQILRGVRTVGEAFTEVDVDVDARAGVEAARDRLR